ncbi:uncharacterized protein [Dermacentor andersoni]|uniref:uncharacterized protein n=1 Tax=Dermacentor andersoni TaxID=34620 RepID=UPI002417CD2D|nr:uncharacterized protein LOC129382927 [Dermacentor andersoni]
MGPFRTVSCVILFYVMTLCSGEGFVSSLLPELSVYQDATECVVVKKLWYLTYTSHHLLELPSNATCVRFALVTPIHRGKALSRLEYNPNGTVYVDSTYESTGGERAKNVIYSRHLPNGAVHRFDVLYNDCDNCKIYSSQSSTGAKECWVYIAQTAMNKENIHCHFIFDLLCGPSYRYIRSDASCLAAKGTKAL